MNLFIDTPQWSAQRSAQCDAGKPSDLPPDVRRCERRVAEAADAGCRQGAVESYYRELEYADRRERRGKVMRVVRFTLLVLAVPVAVAIVFVSSYALTLIANGATPEQVMQGVVDLVVRCLRGLRQIAIQIARA